MEIIVKGSSLTQFGIEGTNYCGPGYADGKLLEQGENATYALDPTSLVDKACMAHDQAYDGLKDSPNPAYDRMQADLKLIDDIAAALASGELSAYDAAVAAAVIGAFMGKTALYDVPAAVLEAARGLLQRLLDALGTEGNPFTADFGYTPLSLISLEVWNDFSRAKTWRWPRDPIILDLDGDGLETVGLASNVYFDHDGDGVLTRTGWAGKDDALLVWDRNANGLIDTGVELFGDFTVLPNGTLAPNGFAALAALDANGQYFFSLPEQKTQTEGVNWGLTERRLWRHSECANDEMWKAAV
ncbi:hypothetical protein [Pelomicrobium sp.]|jgi:hypothetical protein|uniref:hypothetical protein n=1 Tax=Pelomicrobium sp. TaxID=2815319 RepID=UPI002FDD178F